MSFIYLDAAATANYSEKDDIVVDTIIDAMKRCWQNPSSLYASNVKEVIDSSRKQIAEFIGAKSDEIYFTSGASESNNWAIKGWIEQASRSTWAPYRVITTPIEHKSILKIFEDPILNYYIRYCDIDENGLVRISSLRKWLRLCENNNVEEKAPVLVSIGMANNEIGTLQNIKEIADVVHEFDGIIHVDATQALPCIPIDVEELCIDMMSCSGHKISPVLKGIGFLYKKNCINIQPLICGAQENGLRGGTENTLGIVGLAKAVELCDVGQERFRELCSKRDYFVGALQHKFGCKLNGHYTYRLPNNINVTFPQNITGESLLYMLDMEDIKMSTGSACNSKEISPSHVLKAIGLTDEQAMRTVRFTLSDDITYEDIDKVIEEIEKAIKLIET